MKQSLLLEYIKYAVIYMAGVGVFYISGKTEIFLHPLIWGLMFIPFVFLVTGLELLKLINKKVQLRFIKEIKIKKTLIFFLFVTSTFMLVNFIVTKYHFFTSAYKVNTNLILFISYYSTMVKVMIRKRC